VASTQSSHYQQGFYLNLALYPVKGTFHTCKLEAGAAQPFTRGYETWLRSTISTAFALLLQTISQDVNNTGPEALPVSVF